MQTAGHPKSRFRGVYRCGRRWKAQLQSQGIQFYLGTFDTEEEAARAYDRKARDEKGGNSQTNFDDLGSETVVCQPRGNQPPESFFENENSGYHIEAEGTPSKRLRPNYPGYTGNAMYLSGTHHQLPVNQVKVMWERLCQISQRILLANAAQAKLSELQLLTPDTVKADLLRSLEDEIVLLNIVKSQLEEAISRSFSNGMLPTATAAPLPSISAVTPRANNSTTSTTSTTAAPLFITPPPTSTATSTTMPSMSLLNSYPFALPGVNNQSTATASHMSKHILGIPVPVQPTMSSSACINANNTYFQASQPEKLADYTSSLANKVEKHYISANGTTSAQNSKKQNIK